MKKILFYIFVIILIVSGIFIVFLLKNDNSLNETSVNQCKQSLGVWWWDNKIDNSYLDFAKQNDVTEIYLYTSSFNDKIATLIKNAKTKNMEVYWLAGKYEWIENYSLLETFRY